MKSKFRGATRTYYGYRALVITIDFAGYDIGLRPAGRSQQDILTTRRFERQGSFSEKTQWLIILKGNRFAGLSNNGRSELTATCRETRVFPGNKAGFFR